MSVMPRQISLYRLTAGVLLVSALAGCSSSGFRRVKPTVLEQARESVPEEELLDVGVAVSEADELSESRLRKLGTNEDIRKSECHYIPYHLKNTLQMSGHWGSVQVVPPEAENVDLKIMSTLYKSNGERLQVKVEVVDAIGRRWFRRKYQQKVKEEHYESTAQGSCEVYQDLYNTLANDLSEFKLSLTAEEIEQIRTASKLRFAREFAPDAFDDYLEEDDEGRLTIQHVPSDDDPLMARIERIRERDYLFVDTLNQYYEGIYTHMWDAYENWRKYNRIEQEALRKVEREAIARTIAGVALIAGAIALQVADVQNMEVASAVLIMAGGHVVVSGVDVSKQAQIHAAAIEELGESFGAEMRPTIIEFEGKQYELTGTASEQYGRWKQLLRRIYREETGFDDDEQHLAVPPPAPAVVSVDR